MMMNDLLYVFRRRPASRSNIGTGGSCRLMACAFVYGGHSLMLPVDDIFSNPYKSKTNTLGLQSLATIRLHEDLSKNCRRIVHRIGGAVTDISRPKQRCPFRRPASARIGIPPEHMSRWLYHCTGAQSAIQLGCMHCDSRLPIGPGRNPYSLIGAPAGHTPMSRHSSLR